MKLIIYLEVLVLGIICLIPILKDKKFKFYNPPHILSVVYFLNFGLPTIYMINNLSLYIYYPHIREECLIKSMIFIILVYAFFLSGYYLSFKNRDINKVFEKLISKLPDINSYKIEIKNLPFVILIFLTLGWISRILLFKLGIYIHTEAGEYAEKIEGLKLYGQYIYIGSILPTFCVLFLFMKWLENENKMPTLFFSILFLVFDTAYYLPTGSKERVLMPFLLLFIMYSIKKKLNWGIIFISFVFVFLFIFPYTTVLREINTGKLFMDLTYALELYLNALFTNNSFFSDLIYYTIGIRLNYTEVVTNIVENTPRIWNFKLGYTYLVFFTAFIPRFLWQNKPEGSGLSEDFGFDYGYKPMGGSTSVGLSWVGEMFINFGWFGILCGFFYGLFYSFLFRYFVGKKKISELSIVFYIMALYFMLRSEMFSMQFGGLFKQYFSLLIFLFPFLKRQKNGK